MLRKLIQQLTSQRVGRRLRHRRSRGLRVESLEERALLASLTVSIAEASISENGGVANAVVTRDAETSGDLVVNLASDDGAEATVPLTVTIPDGQEAAAFMIVGVDEQTVDATHQVTITATADGFDPGSDTIDITNDDRATLSVGDATVTEGNEGTTTLSFPVTLDAAVDVDVSVDYITQDGTATAADGDYVDVATPARFTMYAGETSGTIDIVIKGNSKVEASETLRLLLSNLQKGDRDVTLATSMDWYQLGQDVDGEVAGDLSGTSVSMSSDGNTIVIADPSNDENHSRYTRVFRLTGGQWVQLGQTIIGEVSDALFGRAVSLSGDGNTVVIGTRANDTQGRNAGQARVYRFDGMSWIQLGQNIDGKLGDEFGSSVSLSDDGNILVVGAPFNITNGVRAGQTRAYRFDGAVWNQLGQAIDGEAASDRSGWSVSVSGDGNTLAIGAILNDGSRFDAGHARVYRYDGFAWNQLGQDMDGEAGFDEFGYSVALSSDGNTVAIGAPRNIGSDSDISASHRGHTRVFRFDGTQWDQLGEDLDGVLQRENSGRSVSLSGDGNTVLIGAPDSDGDGSNSGHVRAYYFDGIGWTLLGRNINGESKGDEFGQSVWLSADGTSAIVGAPRNDGNGTNAGHARVYRLQAFATGTIINDDSARVTADNVSATEGSGLTFTVELDTDVQGGFTVEARLSAQTATAGSTPLDFPEDYLDRRFQLKFTGLAGETQQFTVDTLDDAVVELPETFVVNLSSSNPLVDVSDTATGTINDDDHATLSVGDATVTEGDSGTPLLSFPVTLDTPVDVDVSVDYITQDGTASAADGDYVPVTTPATLTINAGDTSGVINITVNGDTPIESDETLSLLLTKLQSGGRDVSLNWIQLGQDIDGETERNGSGWSVSLSREGNTVAIGAPFNDRFGSDFGHVRMYRFEGGDWHQLGQDIDGEGLSDLSGWSVALSGDGNTLAVGAISNDGNGQEAGHTRVYRFDGNDWTQIGQDIDGEAAGDVSGRSVSVSEDGNTLAIGMTGFFGAYNHVGQVRVYHFDGTDWTQIGQKLEGIVAGNHFGFSVSLSGDGDKVAVGAPLKDVNDNFFGHTHVYHFDGVDWIQIGQTIVGESTFDQSGWSVSLNTDGNTLAIGAPFNDDVSESAGHARVYRFDGADWNQLGRDIDGKARFELSGWSVSLSGDGNMLVIGAPGDDFYGDPTGRARAYRFNGTDWTQLGEDIEGEAFGDEAGYSVSISDDGTTLVLGARYNDGNGEKAGQVRVYRPQSAAMGTIIDDDALQVEFSEPTGTDTESSGRNLPQLLVTGTIQSGHQVTIDAAVIDGTASGGGVDFNGPTTVTIPAGTYNATPVAIMGLSIAPDTIIEPDETIELEILPGNQVQLGDANGDGTIQATTMYTIQDDDLQNVRTAVEFDGTSILTIRDFVPGGKADQLELTIVGDRLVITDGNNILGDFGDNTTGNAVDVPLAAILGIEIDLLEGDDQLSIDFSGAPQDLNLSVMIKGGDGHDTLAFGGMTVLGAGDLVTNDEVEDVFVNGPITIQKGTVALTAAESLEVNADISLGTGAIQLTAGRDVFGNCSLVQAGDVDVHLVSGTGIGRVRIETNGDATLDGGSGGIVGCTGQIAVTARSLTLMAGASVGTAIMSAGKVTVVEPFLTRVDVIQGAVGGLGISLVNDHPLTDNVVLAGAAMRSVKDTCPSSGCPGVEGEGSPLHNAPNQFDVNDDGAVSPIDLLAVLNYLNFRESGVQSEGFIRNQVRVYVDVNDDRAASALDALLVINYLNARTVTQPEGESIIVPLDRATTDAGQPLLPSNTIGRARVPNFSERFATVPAAWFRPNRKLRDDMKTSHEWESLLDTLAEDVGDALDAPSRSLSTF